MARRKSLVIIAGLVALSAVWLTAAGQQRGAPPPTTGTAFLAGQVIDATTNQPVSGATVMLIGAFTGRAGGPQAPVVVDSHGRFFFANLPAGTYRTQGGKPGYTPVSIASFDRTIDLAEGERVTTATLRLVKLGSITGAVRDDGGDPLVGVDVLAFDRVVVNGRSSLRRYSQVKTDDRGAYRLTGVRPGDYVICACGQDPMPFDGLLLTTLAADPIQLMGAAARALKVGSDAVTLDSTLRTLAPTFHPNSSTIARATRITVAAGEDKSGIDIDARIVRAARVSGTIVGALNPVVAQSVRLIPAGESGEGTPISQLSPVLVQPDGRFDFAGVPPGQYTLRVQHTVNAARGGGPSGSALQLIGARGATMNALNSGALVANEPVLWADQTLTVGDDGATGLIVPLRRGIPVGGRLQFIGNAPQPPAQALSRAAIFLQPVTSDLSVFAGPSVGRVNEDATFRVPGAPPGRYSLAFSILPGWPTLQSVLIDGVDVTDLPFDVRESDITSMVISFSDAPIGIVTGVVASGLADARDISMVVFSTDRRYWTDPLAARRRITAAPVNGKGIFKTIGLPAGEYFYAVVPDEKVTDVQTTAGFETLSRTAQRVSLAPGQTAVVTVR